MLKIVIVYLDLDCRRGEERRVSLMKFVRIFLKREGELWVGMVGNHSFLISLNRWNMEREKRFKCFYLFFMVSVYTYFFKISKQRKKKLIYMFVRLPSPFT